MKEMMMEMQMIEQQLQQLQQHIKGLDEKIEEVKDLRKGMDEFKKLKVGDEILVPVSNGMFAKAKLLDKDVLKVNVGGGVVVEKSVDDSAKLVEDQIIQLKKLKESASGQFDELLKKGEATALKIRDSENV